MTSFYKPSASLRGRPVHHRKLRSLNFLERGNHLKEVAQLRIADRPQHPHQCIGRVAQRLAEKRAPKALAFAEPLLDSLMEALFSFALLAVHIRANLDNDGMVSQKILYSSVTTAPNRHGLAPTQPAADCS